MKALNLVEARNTLPLPQASCRHDLPSPQRLAWDILTRISKLMTLPLALNLMWITTNS